MLTRPLVFLDPGENWHDEWAFVVVGRPTGVVYQQQCGGTACLQRKLEGYLVPVNLVGTTRAALDDLLLRRLGGAGIGGQTRLLDAEALGVLRSAVTAVGFWHSVEDEFKPHNLELDESRLDAVDEAWLPVLTPDGPGILLWNNSD